MLKDWFRSFRERKSRVFDFLQIEVTSDCNLECTMCLRTALINRWNSMEIPFETYKKISKVFPHVKTVFLQGWGEPLLHKDIFRMIEEAKKAGCSVGFTTNGTLLTPQTSAELIEADVELIAISVAGATRETHERIRRGSNFEQIVKNVMALNDLKQRLNCEKPKVVLSFLMMKQNMHELPLIVKLAKKIGVKEVISANLTCVPTTWHEDQRVFSFKPPRCNFIQYVDEAQGEANRLGISFYPHELEAEEVLVCSENPLKNAYVSSDGYVAPCVCMNLPLKKKDDTIPRIFRGKHCTIKRVNFGNAAQIDILDIWNSRSYQLLRKTFEKRHWLAEIPRSFADDPSYALERIAQLMRVNPLPEVCGTCYKAYGV